ncbi:DUF916 and DUF3324 domain-containing protein [Carnobacterium maltaromaticum]|uniref:DUF916 and DUF3324 domain-containing protein n=1 Tax=Carnobacterium maltaromaticum TaxID=2751 RepID=UPI0012FCC75D|nr:DUF916 and DUF3324 domain-containing protein [Carnobacterium maltaromaticum]
MKYLNFFIVILGVLLLSIINSSKVFADTNDFSVVPILPDNQNIDVLNYFDLKINPDQKQTLKIVVTNTSSELQKFKIAVNTATTNDNGIVDYSMDNFKKDKSLKISLKDCIKLENEEIEIPAKEEKTVSMEMTIPKQKVDGILLGGVVVEPIVKKSELGITNRFTRTIAIRLSENDEDIEPNIVVEDVTIAQENSRNVVKMKVRNIVPKLLSPIVAEITISKKNNSKFILREQKKQLSIAPNSQFYLTTDWKEKFSSGDYVYTVIFKDEAKHKSVFSKEFHVKKNEAYKLNQTSIDKKRFHLQDYYVIIFSILFLCIASYFMYNYMAKK